ncbi:hypothetical protein [Halorhabdus tiamatea]|uniref:Uncharacterized protein n=1 Tax=Halorhabdus tiamatea SARL4B TaxID=1033806 RepID=F7PQZ9_9EURY|nr:hypothetical protein [Halorhabdus tiamatea]CCQ35033.1 conserved hypothetical protein [Halorhabdus tiamatea SARL4B]
MSKTAPDKLTSLVAEELITYLGSGELNRYRLAKSIDYGDLNIADLNQLKTLHFVLSDAVYKFVQKLPERLRRLKTVNKREQTVTRSEVRGRVDWSKTRQRRYRTGYNNRTLFVVDIPEVEYDIPENRVLKKFLASIAEPLREDVLSLDQSWASHWPQNRILRLQRHLQQNVYLKRLPDPADISLSRRDLTAARQSRQTLYSEAERLLQLHQDFLDDRDRPEVRELLESTLVVPTSDARLFELFCVFAMIRRLQARFSGLTIQRIQPGMEELAKLGSNEQEIAIYYDQGGPLSFFEEYPQSETLMREYDVPEALHRQVTAVETQADQLQHFLGRSSQESFYGGRPDFLILRTPSSQASDSPAEVVIGEIKYTRSRRTFATGLRELLEYLFFARNGDHYLLDRHGESTLNVSGVLCTDGVDTNADQTDLVRHLSTDTLLEAFET